MANSSSGADITGWSGHVHGDWRVAGADDWQEYEEGQGDEPRLRAGYENSGHFDIRGTLDDQTGPTIGVLVRHDSCHVQTRNIELVVQ